jgi:hypothetical protein
MTSGTDEPGASLDRRLAQGALSAEEHAVLKAAIAKPESAHAKAMREAAYTDPRVAALIEENFDAMVGPRADWYRRRLTRAARRRELGHWFPSAMLHWPAAFMQPLWYVYRKMYYELYHYFLNLIIIIIIIYFFVGSSDYISSAFVVSLYIYYSWNFLRMLFFADRHYTLYRWRLAKSIVKKLDSGEIKADEAPDYLKDMGGVSYLALLIVPVGFYLVLLIWQSMVFSFPKP